MKIIAVIIILLSLQGCAVAVYAVAGGVEGAFRDSQASDDKK